MNLLSTAQELLGSTEVVLFETQTLVVWIRRPNQHHRNWWLCYYSTDANEALALNRAIGTVAMDLGLGPFHQGCWSYDHNTRHAGCGKLDGEQYSCPGVRQAWEMWIGASEWALEFTDAPLDDIIRCGDPALEKILAAVPQIFGRAALSA